MINRDDDYAIRPGEICAIGFALMAWITSDAWADSASKLLDYLMEVFMENVALSVIALIALCALLGIGALVGGYKEPT